MTAQQPDRDLASVRLPLPWFVWVCAVLAVLVVLAPIVALWSRVDFTGLPGVFAAPETWSMLRISLGAALLATLMCLLIGVPCGVAVGHLGRGAWIARLLVMLPLALPPVVAGLALTAMIGRRGMLAPILDAVGLQFAFRFSGVVAAHVFICLPFVIVAVEAAFRQIDRSMVVAAYGVGLAPSTIWWRIIVPTLSPAVVAGAGLAFARSLGEFGATLTFAGSLPGVTRTLPVGIYLAREIDQGAAYQLAAVLMCVAVAALLLSSSVLITRSNPPVVLQRETMHIDALVELCRPQHQPSPETALHGRRATLTTSTATFSLPSPGITVVVGNNGAGKTTLLQQISGLISGVTVAGLGNTPNRLRKHPGVVLLTQQAALPPRLSVAAAITMVTGDAQHTMRLLDAAGCASWASVKCGRLSGGQARLVALLRALAADGEMVLLDEPFAGFDVTLASQWLDVIARCAKDRTIVLVSHDPGAIRRLADAVVVVDAGVVQPPVSFAALCTARPSSFVAELFGLQVFPGVLAADVGCEQNRDSELGKGVQQQVSVLVGDDVVGDAGSGYGNQQLVLAGVWMGTAAPPAEEVGDVCVVIPPGALTVVGSAANRQVPARGDIGEAVSTVDCPVVAVRSVGAVCVIVVMFAGHAVEVAVPLAQFGGSLPAIGGRVALAVDSKQVRIWPRE
ncbi:ATP-binding cassette domain-containing protein [Corynebacterium choanae]|uniref:Molybdenum transport system permease protein ModB n=1 Tax=Corynebacterium choanae TaxID=1862358 RepID=A0A3G6J6I4_9CORY|nr:ATP-binding cassette domain-containing protein [Corynebacterium choanae]AZA13422.1 Molybdenum transport system permease protein ModB [Corynebacterium choanae]